MELKKGLPETIIKIAETKVMHQVLHAELLLAMHLLRLARLPSSFELKWILWLGLTQSSEQSQVVRTTTIESRHTCA